jgi:hypothetical protein
LSQSTLEVLIDAKTGEVKDTGKGEKGFYRGAVIWRLDTYHDAHGEIYSIGKRMNQDYISAKRKLDDIFSSYSERGSGNIPN